MPVVCVPPTIWRLDGALRALQFYQVGRPFLHGNNHLLYPVDVYAWSTLLQVLGIRANDAIEYLRRAQTMNAIAAAAFYCVVRLCGRLMTRQLIAALVILGYGSSRAFLAHATTLLSQWWDFLEWNIRSAGRLRSLPNQADGLLSRED